MIKSINHPWAISEKFISKYGQLWSNLDFVFENHISEENFKTDPMNVVIGQLQIAKQTIPMRYIDLISYAKSLQTFTTNMYTERVGKQEIMSISIKGREFSLLRHEVAKLTQTIVEACDAAIRAYELGLYL